MVSRIAPRAINLYFTEEILNTFISSVL